MYTKNGSFFRKCCELLLVHKNPIEVLENYASDWSILENAINTYDTVILSDEGIFLTPDNNDETNQSLYDFWKVLIGTLSSLGVEKVSVIMYLRQQDQYLSSLWKQECKTGRNALSFQDFCLQLRNLTSMDYYTMIDAIEKSLRDSDNVIVRKYDKDHFLEGDIFHDFCLSTSIKWDSRYSIPKKYANPSISYDVAEAIRIFHFCGRRGNYLRDDILIPLAYELSSKYPDIFQCSPLNADNLNQLLAHFDEGNRKISKVFFAEDSLFSHPQSNSTWKYNRITIVKLRLIILCKLLFNRKGYIFLRLCLQKILRIKKT